MTFSWTTVHNPPCQKALPVPFFVPASAGLIVNYPLSISKMIREPVARKLYSNLLRIDEAVIGSSVDVVLYNATRILSAKRRFDNGEMISFICPSFFDDTYLGTSWILEETADASEDWISGNINPNLVFTTLLGRGGAHLSTCDTPSIAQVTCRLERIPNCQVRVTDHKYPDNVIAQGPFVVLFATTTIPAGFSLVRPAYKLISDSSADDACDNTAPAISYSPSELLSAAGKQASISDSRGPRALKRTQSKSPTHTPGETPTSDFENANGSCSDEELEIAIPRRGVNKKARVSTTQDQGVGDDASTKGRQGWVKHPFTGPWHELPSGWPFVTAQTHHRSGRNNRELSEPHQRTNAIQFAIDKFERSNNANVDFVYVLRKFKSWTPSITHRHLRLGKCFNLPLSDHDSDWVSTSLERAANDAPLWTSGVTADMLEELLPERRTDWSELELSNTIAILTCASLWCSTHIHATTSMVILVVTGATSIAWMTKAQYMTVLNDLTYNTTTSLTACPNERHSMFLRNAAPGTALYIRPDALFELKLQPNSTVVIMSPRSTRSEIRRSRVSESARESSATASLTTTGELSTAGVLTTAGERSTAASLTTAGERSTAGVLTTAQELSIAGSGEVDRPPSPYEMSGMEENV